jgi:hypothetical protein
MMGGGWGRSGDGFTGGHGGTGVQRRINYVCKRAQDVVLIT